jgi:GNAT superfamily N-acetyltransferase
VTVNVRKAEEGDIPGIVALWEEFMELLRHTNRDYWKVSNGRAAFSRYLVGAVGETDVLVAVSEEKGTGLVGFSLARIETLPEWFGSEQIGLVRYLSVAEDHRGRGVGHEMAAFVIDWFRSLGIRRVELYVLKGLPASDFWSKLGLKEFMDRRFVEI